MNQLRRLLPYYRPYRLQLVAGLVLVVISTAITSVIPWILKSAVDAIRSGESLNQVMLLAAAIVTTALFAGFMRYSMRQILNTLSRRIEYDLRNDLFIHLQTLDASYFARNRTGDIMARLTNDLGAVRMAAGPAVMYLTNTIIGGLFALFFMLRIDVRLTLLAMLPLVALPLITAYLAKAVHDRFEAVQEHFSTLTTRAQENLTGARIVRAYRQEEAEIARFAALNDEYLTRNMALARLSGTMHPLFALLGGLGGVVVLGAGGLLVLRGGISVGAFVAFGLYLNLLTWPLIALGWVINLFQRGAASMARLTEILDARSLLSAPLNQSRTSLPATNGGRSIEFRDVGFHFPTGDVNEQRWVLRNVSFTVPAGASLGVVGATGSGKSALMGLIPRLYDPQEGEIFIDGISIRDVPLGELRREIGFVPQESLLFSDTIAANLGYGSNEAGTVEWAAQMAQLDSTIEEFPGKYDTMLGERGINLSGGQKQRASLARALARRPAIVLLDDALSAVDTHTEAAILGQLRGALTSRTAVIASHRVSAIRNSSWIIVLDEGRIVEQGRHEELMIAEGRYWSLLRRQQLVESIEIAREAESTLVEVSNE
ncbi:MAG TPA: ABC transporter ATP-binding protein [Gemmatimonadaceae bacterium]|nr:ABC transporter ATP-binding protein [Gemmatimonadaceae bacterium]